MEVSSRDMDPAQGSLHCVLCHGPSSIPALEAKRSKCNKFRDTRDSQDKQFMESNFGSVRSAPWEDSRAVPMMFSLTVLGSQQIGLQTVYVAVVVAALLMAPSVVGFNIDVQRAIVHRGENGSMFGYAVAQHIDQSTNW